MDEDFIFNDCDDISYNLMISDFRLIDSQEDIIDVQKNNLDISEETLNDTLFFKQNLLQIFKELDLKRKLNVMFESQLEDYKNQIITMEIKINENKRKYMGQIDEIMKLNENRNYENSLNNTNETEELKMKVRLDVQIEEVKILQEKLKDLTFEKDTKDKRIQELESDIKFHSTFKESFKPEFNRMNTEIWDLKQKFESNMQVQKDLLKNADKLCEINENQKIVIEKLNQYLKGMNASYEKMDPIPTTNPTITQRSPLDNVIIANLRAEVQRLRTNEGRVKKKIDMVSKELIMERNINKKNLECLDQNNLLIMKRDQILQSHKSNELLWETNYDQIKTKYESHLDVERSKDLELSRLKLEKEKIEAVWDETLKEKVRANDKISTELKEALATRLILEELNKKWAEDNLKLQMEIRDLKNKEKEAIGLGDSQFDPVIKE